jgi:hypothetical protein
MTEGVEVVFKRTAGTWKIEQLRRCLQLHVGVVAILIGAVSACGPADQVQSLSGRIPIPAGARELNSSDQGGGAVQAVFKMKTSQRSTTVRNFYDEWASKNGWKRLSAEDELWAADEWQEISMGSRIISQRLTLWRSEDAKESLRLVVRQDRSLDEQDVAVILGPYESIDSSVDWIDKSEAEKWKRVEPGGAQGEANKPVP